MSLYVYLDKQDVPAKLGVPVVYNDSYFGRMPLRDDSITMEILDKMDKVKCYSSCNFLSRTEEQGRFFTDKLSTGCKTLLNIVYNPDVCFDIWGCGRNALDWLFTRVTDGHVLWRHPRLDMDWHSSCDIVVDWLHFTNMGYFLDYANRVRPVE